MNFRRDDTLNFPLNKTVNPSFVDLLRESAPHLLPDSTKYGGEIETRINGIPKGTTILSLKFKGGVIMVGDRRATEGFQISHTRIDKVHKTDEYSALAISGVAGPSFEMVRLFKTELEHYEKVEGEGLSLEGKANKLAQLIRLNFPMAMQGLIIIPIFAGYDIKRHDGRIFKYDVTGGKYEELDYYAAGSGGKDARNTIKKLFKKDLSRKEGIEIALEALIDASEEDAGTAGPDTIKNIYPTVITITLDGITEAQEAEIAEISKSILMQKMEG